ncbi:MAG: MIP/aquaporin family protein [Segniliparus sp.]|uniref:MIP/aquaporin family protein n=1 Tax=Segniliparus sp. TaxID=2804064 RepID=UPI003F342F90
MFNAYLAEFLGTTTLLLLGCATSANAALAKTKGSGAGMGWLAISFGWGLAVFAGAYVGFASGALLNPALTLGAVVRGTSQFANGVPATAANVAGYLAAQFLGGFVGAVLAWLAYKPHYDAETDPAKILGTFATGPAVRSPAWNFVTEVIATFVLAFVVFHFAGTPAKLGPLPVALLVVGIGLALGGPTAYSLNPARDLAPRLAHAILPIPGKGVSDWRYAPVASLGPVAGALLAGLAVRLLPYMNA